MPQKILENLSLVLSARNGLIDFSIFITCNDLNVYNCLQIKKGQTLNSVFAQFSMSRISLFHLTSWCVNCSETVPFHKIPTPEN